MTEPKPVVPTPLESAEEAAAYWGGREAYEATLTKLRFRVTIFVAGALIIGLVMTSVFFAKIDSKVSAIRTTQVANTRHSDCQVKALNSLLRDVPLAFAGDKNPHDYSKVNHKC